MEKSTELVAVVIGVGIVAGLAIILAKRVQDSGGVGGILTDTLVGTPDHEGLAASKSYKSQFTPGAEEHLFDVGGLAVGFLSPTQGATINREHYFGSGYKVRFYMDNPSADKARQTEVILETSEDNLFGNEAPVSTNLGHVTIPPRTRMEFESSLLLRAHSTFWLDITAVLIVGGSRAAQVKFSLG